MPAISMKHAQLTKANKSVIAAVSVGVFILVSGLFMIRAITMRYSHHSKVIAAKSEALTVLDANIEAKNKIVNTYNAFTDSSVTENIIGGTVSDEGLRGGDNARLVLDALPSKYDFPALATSVENLITVGGGYAIESITGDDDEVNQAAQAAAASPQPIEIPIAVAVVDLDFAGGKKTLELFERSIRPFKAQKLTIAGQDNALEILVEYMTYYQPKKIFEIEEQVIQ